MNLEGYINSSETKVDIKEIVSTNFKQATKILESYKKEYGETSERYQKIFKAYSKFNKNIENAIISENEITQSELNSLKTEFKEIKRTNKSDIKEKIENKLYKDSNISRSALDDFIENKGFKEVAIDSDSDSNTGYVFYGDSIGAKLNEEKNFSKLLLTMNQLNGNYIQNITKGETFNPSEDGFESSDNFTKLETKKENPNTVINIYIKEILKDENKDNTKINDILNNLDSLKGLGMCPSNESIIKLNEKKLELLGDDFLNNAIEFYGDEALGKELIKTIKEKTKKIDPCKVTIFKIITEFNKKHNKTLNEEQINKLIEGKLKINKQENLNQVIQIIDESGDDISNIDKIVNSTSNNPELQKLIEKRNKINNALNNNFSTEEYSQIIQSLNEGIDPFEIRNKIKEQREQKEKKEKSKQVEQKVNGNKEGNKSGNKEISKYTLNTSIENPILEAPDGEKIKISIAEAKNIKEHPEAAENLVNFHNFFKELNLEGVWKYRKDLILAIGDININPNDDDSLKTEELRKFGNKLLTFIDNIENKGEKQTVQINNINGVNHKLREFSGANSGLNDSKTFNINGEDKFTAYLRKEGIIGGAYFKVNEFRKYL